MRFFMGSVMAVQARLEDAFKTYDNFGCLFEEREQQSEIAWLNLKFTIEEVLVSGYINPLIRMGLVNKLKEVALKYYNKEDCYLRDNGPAFDVGYFLDALETVAFQATSTKELQCVLDALLSVRRAMRALITARQISKHERIYYEACEIELLREFCRSEYFTKEMALKLCEEYQVDFYNIFCDEVLLTVEFIPVFGHIFHKLFVSVNKTYPMMEAVRDELARIANEDPSLLQKLRELSFKEHDVSINIIVALAPNLLPHEIHKFAISKRKVERFAVAMNNTADVHILAVLSQDEDAAISSRAIQTLFEIESQDRAELKYNPRERERIIKAREFLNNCGLTNYQN